MLASLSRASDALYLRNGAYLCCEPGVEVDTTAQMSLSKVFFGPGLFVLRASGYGILAMHSYGSMVTYELAPGEKRSVDNGHVVAWTASMHYHVGLANRSLFTSVTSGECLMVHFEGPGRVYVQSHNPQTVMSANPHPTNTTTHVQTPLASCCQCLFLLVFFIMFMSFLGVFLYALMHSTEVQSSDIDYSRYVIDSGARR